MRRSLKQAVWDSLDGDCNDGPYDRVPYAILMGLIVLTTVAIIAESIPSVKANPVWHARLNAFERLTLWTFAVEYVLRLWSSAVAFRSRAQFAVSGMGLVDLAALLPLILPVVGVDLRLYPVLRATRVFRMVKLARFIPGADIIARAMHRQRSALLGSLSLLLLVLICGSTVMYYVESAAQPDKFPSIPHAAWWAVATMTTTGYGDVFPITPMGKLLGGMFSILGIFTFALPTAILGSAFMDELARVREAEGQANETAEWSVRDNVDVPARRGVSDQARSSGDGGAVPALRTADGLAEAPVARHGG